MIHYTLNTAHSRVSPRSEVSDAAVIAVSPMLSPGDYPMPGMDNYVVHIEVVGKTLLATVYGGPPPRPCLTMAVAVDDQSADEAWQRIERRYLGITEQPGIRSADFAAPRKPDSAPWCAAMTILATPDEAHWLADFERCLAWAWIDQRQ